MNAEDQGYRVFEGDAEAWNRLVAEGDEASLLQTWEYGEAKARLGAWRVERGILVDGGAVFGAVQTLIRPAPVPGTGMAWVNRGPVCSAENYSHGLTALARYFCDRRGLYLRVQPALPAESLAEGFDGLGSTTTHGWASAVVDLSQPEEALRKNLHGKWRNALVRAERTELDIRIGSDDEAFGAFMDGHHAHLERLGTGAGLDPALLSTLQEMLPANQKLLFLVAYKAGTYLGGAALARYGTTGEYLAGHNAEAGRVDNAGQLLLWSAMLRLKADGYSRFDLGGMDERLTPPGIFQFKQRIGARPYRLANELEGGTQRLVNKLIRWRVERERRGNGAGGRS